MSFLILSGSTTLIFAQESENFPDWFKINFKLHEDKHISDKEFVSGLVYLIEKKIILVTESEQKMINILIDKNVDVLARNFEFSQVLSNQNNDINFIATADILTNDVSAAKQLIGVET